MKQLTKQQKILAGLVGAGLCAVIVDRVFLAEPVAGADEAEASAVAEYAAGTPENHAAMTTLASDFKQATGVEGTVAHRLQTYAAGHGVDSVKARDAFRPSEAWVMPAAATVEAEKPKDDPVARFAEAHRLMAVMGSGDRAVAIVDGQPMRVGQRLDGFTLVQIRSRAAAFAAPAGRVELKLADQP